VWSFFLSEKGKDNEANANDTYLDARNECSGNPSRLQAAAEWILTISPRNA